MKYTITAVKRTPIAKKDGTGTWTKMQVKTAQTGAQILDLGFSIAKNVKDNLKSGDIITGYVESRPWNSNGKSGVNITLNGITAEYVYELLLKINPSIEGLSTGLGVTNTPNAPVAPKNDGWEGQGDDIQVEEGVDEEVGF